MNAKALIAASIFTLIGTAATAQEITVDVAPASAATTLTREQVRADLAQAHANGQFDQRGSFYAQHSFASRPSTSAKTRADVKQEVLRARAAGNLETSGELYGAGTFAPTASAKTRAEVSAEAAAALAQHVRLSQGEKNS